MIDALRECVAALVRVQPQVRGILPEQDVAEAIRVGKEALACGETVRAFPRSQSPRPVADVRREYIENHLGKPMSVLPDGVITEQGKLTARCCVCGKRDHIDADLSDISMTGYKHYCGRSPQCCP